MIATRMKSLPSRLLLAAALATALPAPPLWAQPSTRSESGAVRLPSLGESSGEDFSVGTERRLGVDRHLAPHAAVARERGDTPHVEDR